MTLPIDFSLNLLELHRSHRILSELERIFRHNRDIRGDECAYLIDLAKDQAIPRENPKGHEKKFIAIAEEFKETK